ncbi:MAG TPA: hypothetical protein PLX63_02950, partial [Rectinema sp.]|nr:hypothetical protein [Rectinema sp.]
ALKGFATLRRVATPPAAHTTNRIGRNQCTPKVMLHIRIRQFCYRIKRSAAILDSRFRAGLRELGALFLNFAGIG